MFQVITSFATDILSYLYSGFLEVCEIGLYTIPILLMHYLISKKFKNFAAISKKLDLALFIVLFICIVIFSVSLSFNIPIYYYEILIKSYVSFVIFMFLILPLKFYLSIKDDEISLSFFSVFLITTLCVIW